MIIITGAAGFIGSVVLGSLNAAGIENLVIVDKFGIEAKEPNLASKKFIEKIERGIFIDWFEKNAGKINAVVHIGARTDTTEFNVEIFNELNLNYTKDIWKICTKHGIPMVYASSAATYGGGEHGYNDDHQIVQKLKPLNPYGDSKNDFDKWALQQEATPPNWYGLKFFNVYGPNEYHKGRMASVIFHSFKQIKQSGGIKLFRSHKPEFMDGEQLRDFVYVKDVASVILFLLENKPSSGLYNLGTGQARTFLDLARNTFAAMGKSENISFVDTPEDIRDKYQYFTEANMAKLRNAGYQKPFSTLEQGVSDYVGNYLMKGKFF